MELNEILALPVDHGGPTIRHFFYELLAMVILEQECFNGKRPWGNSGWMHDLYKPLIQCGLIEGYIDDDGYVDGVSHTDAEKFIVNSILKPFFNITQ